MPRSTQKYAQVFVRIFYYICRVSTKIGIGKYTLVMFNENSLVFPKSLHNDGQTDGRRDRYVEANGYIL